MSPKGLTVAVTGPTGEIGRAFVRALDAAPGVASIVGMARSPWDPKAEGLKKTKYRQGDVLERADVDRLVDGADVVVHLAFLIFGSDDESRRVNLEGSRNVFEAAADSGAKRLVYTSSVAAYGFHAENPQPLTEEVEPLGYSDLSYSAQKAELEHLLDDVIGESSMDAYVFRPCAVLGATALMPVKKIPAALRRSPVKPLVPDPGVPFQLVHEDDVASALVAATLGKGSPGIYNLAGDGEVTLSDAARALGWYSIKVPEPTARLAAWIASRIPRLPPIASWINAIRVPVIMDCSKAKKELGWSPLHDSAECLKIAAAAAREQGLIR